MQPSDSMASLPSVTLIVSAYNEQEVIQDKLRNCLELDYPKEKLDIVVASDGSTDATDAIVRSHADHRVKIVRCEGRIGKTACLNHAVPLTTGSIVVFSDANSFYDRSALKHLAARFADPAVGFVTGHTKYSTRDSAGDLAPVSLYARLETWVKNLESRIGSCVGADGAIFAVRKERYCPLAADDINDLVLPLKIIRQGYRGVLEQRAFCVEKAGGSSAEEYMRQVRITSRTLKAIFDNANLLNPIKYPLFAWQLASHKLTRLLTPFLLILLLASTFVLVLRGQGAICGMALACQTAFYFLAASGRKLKGRSLIAKIAPLAHIFVTVNAAVLVGWIKYLRGERYTSWTSRRAGRASPRTAEADCAAVKTFDPPRREP